MSRKRKYPVMFWVSEEELIKIKDKMALASCNPGINLSNYLRRCALGKDIVVIPGLRDLIIEVKSIINNLNKLTCKVNNGEIKVIGSNLTEIKEDLKGAWLKLSKALNKI